MLVHDHASKRVLSACISLLARLNLCANHFIKLMYGQVSMFFILGSLDALGSSLPWFRGLFCLPWFRRHVLFAMVPWSAWFDVLVSMDA